MNDETKNEGTWIGVGISIVMLLGSFIGCVISGIAASELSEGDAVQISYLTVPFIVAGLVAWLPAILARKKGMARAIGAPVGCGCLAGIFSGIGLVVFYIVLWPSL